MSLGVELMNSVRYESPSRSEIRIARISHLLFGCGPAIRLEVGKRIWMWGMVVELA
jgi:hypothetical protein